MPALTTPFLDPGCLCAGLLPAQPIDMNLSVVPGMTTALERVAVVPDGVEWIMYAHVTPNYRVTWDQEIAVAVDRLGPDAVRPGTFRGYPSMTMDMEKNGRMSRQLVFRAGDRAFWLGVIPADWSDAQSDLDALTSTFQFL
ncbi:hypothetical protein EBN03_33135 [Nocardia stercoris]|uniref:Uncharacterized protein n=1 Tax=Nocardia stercoris TaxID=2483361 RepID=A0A3M2KW39_9NOCA|nr:hypothetical protein EBN03_33135 [Nocardia stercoris]